MILMTGRREGPGHREQHHFLAIEYLVGGLPAGSFGRHHAKLCFGNMIAHLDGHSFDPRFFWSWKMTPSADGAVEACQPLPALLGARASRPHRRKTRRAARAPSGRTG